MKWRFLNHLFPVIFLTISASALADNQFKPGTRWTYYSDVDCSGSIEDPLINIFTLGEAGEHFDTECMPLYRGSLTGDGGQTLETYVKTEGDKVYFLADTRGQDWRLWYDFSLREGDEVTVWSRPIGFDETSASTCNGIVVRCTGRDSDSDYNGWPTIKFVAAPIAAADDPDAFTVEGDWLNGIGTSGYLTHTVSQIFDGTPIWLVKVTRGDEVVCERKVWSASKDSIINDDTQFIVDGRTVNAIDEVSVYDADGSLVARRRGEVELPDAGFYIVNTPNASAKIIVR